MMFKFGTRRQGTNINEPNFRLSMGGQLLETTERYKYLGLLFTPNLKFDAHVTEYLLPKVRRISGHVRHLLSKLKTGRCTFLRILWLSKIQPILEYGSAVWSSFISRDSLQNIDFFQKEFFRKSMGLPPKTSGSGLLCDFSIMSMSLRYERERVKLRARLDCSPVAAIVHQQLATYQSVNVNRVLRFKSSTKLQSVHMRRKYIRDNPHSILVPRRESYQKYVQTLIDRFPCKHEYRDLYPNYNKPLGEEWVAKLVVKQMPTFPTVRLDVRQKFDRAIDNMKKSCVRLNLPVQMLLNRLIPRETRKFFCKLQWDQFLQDSPNNILTQYRDSWYHDPLLHQLNDPFMRIIRKCRLGVSELRSHSWFHNQNRSKKSTL